MGESWTSKYTLLPAGFTLILRGVLRDPGRTVQLYVDRDYLDRNDFEGNLDALQAHLFDNIRGNMRPLFFEYM